MPVGTSTGAKSCTYAQGTRLQMQSKLVLLVCFKPSVINPDLNSKTTAEFMAEDSLCLHSNTRAISNLAEQPLYALCDSQFLQ